MREKEQEEQRLQQKGCSKTRIETPREPTEPPLEDVPSDVLPEEPIRRVEGSEGSALPQKMNGKLAAI